jgi:hypothetical protein
MSWHLSENTEENREKRQPTSGTRILHIRLHFYVSTVAVSIPDQVIGCLHLSNHSSRSVALGLTERLT